jgi:N-acetylneuraminic acid mutarotase
VSWVDARGNFWLFGGDSLAAPGHYSGSTNDLWKYNPDANTWTWVSGDDSPGVAGVYGTKGVASPDNVPGAREDAASWSDAAGGLWLFGGWGPDSGGHWGELNDLWRFDTATNRWTWVSGSQDFCQAGVYGTKGIAAPENAPGGRTTSLAWIDSSGKLWLFSGFGYDSLGEMPGSFNDLWRFDPVTLQWTWVFGDDRASAGSSYGTKGLPLPSNDPGPIEKAATWIDRDDNLWLFGGEGTRGLSNALWKFDTTSLEWTWVAGSELGNEQARYGTKGVASTSNVPGSVKDAFAWPGANGEFWVFGGYGYTATGTGLLNDLWMFDPTTLEWAWMDGSSSPGDPGFYGTLGNASLWNYPGGRFGGVSWKAGAQGELWLFGGYGFDQSGNDGELNDLWRFHSIGPATPPLTAVRVTLAPGDVSVDRTESVQFHAKVHNSPNDAVVWSLSGDGCSGGGCGTLSDSGLYIAPETVPSPAAVTVTATAVADPSKSAHATITIVDAALVVTVSPDSGGVYVGESVLFRTSVQHVNDHAVTWSLSGAGCSGASCGTVSDSGLYTAPPTVPDPPFVTVTATSVVDPSRSASATITVLEAVADEWAWISGSDMPDEGDVFGQKGIADPANVPGGREGAASWTDLSGRLWLFGGTSTAPGQQGTGNDLWMFDPATREWTWQSGSSLVDRAGSYGTMGVPDPTNVPGARAGPATWTGASGDLWLFGGSGFGIDHLTAGSLSDLWRYDIVAGEWTWISGNQGLYWHGSYGTKGIPDPANKPGARSGAVRWTDAAGSLWLFGGWGYDSAGSTGLLNDLWKFDVASSEWTWESGSDTFYQAGVYGTKGEGDQASVPGARSSAVSWLDSQGRLWLFGGTGVDSANLTGRMNDLWRYDPGSRQWTWIAGANVRDPQGVYGTRGVPAPSNGPGGRDQAVSWRGSDDKLWLFGGYGLDGAIHGDTMLNDLWCFDPGPREWTWVSGSSSGSQDGLYGVKGIADAANTPGARQEAVSWVDLHGDLWLFGGNGFGSYRAGGMLNDLWRYYRRK